MGCGKSSVSRALGEITGLPVVEIDELVREKAGMTINEIFETKGEEYFRKLESEALAGTAGAESIEGSDEAIVSCGGGILLRPENRELISGGVTVWVDATPEEILRRLEGDDTRPLLKNRKTPELLAELKDERDTYYKFFSDFRILTDGYRVKDVADRVMAWISENCQ